MDDKKDIINNADSQTNDNMNYSFDFADQVDNTTSATSESPVITEPSTPMSEDTTEEVSNAAEVTIPETTSESFGTPVMASVTSEVTTSENTSEAPATVGQTTEPPAAETPIISGVPPVTPEMTGTGKENSEEENLELIKDKKETKRFLVILFVILLVFIIALPFIFNVAG